MKLDEDKRTKK